jgi:hypothetical protein
MRSVRYESPARGTIGWWVALVATIHCAADSSSFVPSRSDGGGASAGSAAGATVITDQVDASPSGSGGVSGGASEDEASAFAGSPDAEAREASTSDAGSECPGLFCEDFERGAIDSDKWDVQTMGGATVVIEQDQVAHGKYAARFHGLGVPSGGANAAYVYLLTKNAPPALRTHNFGRASYFITPKPTSINLAMMFGGTTGFPRPTYLSIAEHSGGWQLGFIKLSGSPAGERQAYPNGQMPVGRWSCLEWELNDQPDEIHLWGDGVAIGTLDPNHIDYPAGHVAGAPIFNNASSGLVGGFTVFGFGFYDWHPSGFDFDIDYDDIVLDTQRVGCPSPGGV